MATVKKILSDQTIAVYKLLGRGSALTAKEIADSLNILPNAVYRVVEELAQLGMVEQLDSYPVRFKAIPYAAAMNSYLASITKDFQKEFKPPKQNKHTASPSITLVKDRMNMLLQEDVDIRAASDSIDFIVSGLEVPDATVLAFRKAATLGVKIRAIVQQRRETSAERLEQWHELGAAVRYLPNLKMRLVVIDQKITYITSYDPDNKNRAFGVRFYYRPLAVQMSGLFEQHWQNASDLH